MMPLTLFLLGCVILYVGVVQAAFSALMRLPLRLNAERSEWNGRPETLGHYLEDPVRLFVPARLLQALATIVATMLVMMNASSLGHLGLLIVFAGLTVFVVTCGHVLPLILVRRSPERVIEILLPSFNFIVRTLSPITRPLIGLLNGVGRHYSDRPRAFDGKKEVGNEGSGGESDFLVDEHEERKLLKSVVEFGDTLVREVMTPRPDIVAVKSSATRRELTNLFSEQKKSRIPYYKANLDEILGFVFVKDLVALDATDVDDEIIERLKRPPYVVPETKRVAALLKEFQQRQVQIAIVHDEYGGTSGLVTIEDLLEELVGEIRDEYDVEAEPIVDEGEGRFVFAGTVGVDDAASCLDVEIERQGFETVGGYLLARLGRVPRMGEQLHVDEVNVEILEAERRRIQRVRMYRRPAFKKEPSDA
jgi:CBS domain containing-hemolysin-like protein